MTQYSLNISGLRLERYFSYRKERLRIEIFNDTIHDSIYVSGKCDTVTVEKL